MKDGQSKMEGKADGRAGGKTTGGRKLDTEHFRGLLAKERKRVLDELGYIESNYMRTTPKEASGSGSAYSMHPADMGTDSNEQEKAYLIGSTSGSILEDIDDALMKLDGASYGICERCGQEITIERLDAVPYARLCLKCKTEIENARGATA